MKKLTLALAVVAIAFTLTSCKKDYTCTCTDPISGTPVAIPLNNSSKSDAQTACDAENAVYALVGGSCTLN